MRQSKFTETHIVRMLKEVDAGRPANEIWWRYGISPTTYYKWNATYGGLVRLDNGPEFRADRFASWCADRGIALRGCGSATKNGPMTPWPGAAAGSVSLTGSLRLIIGGSFLFSRGVLHGGSH